MGVCNIYGLAYQYPEVLGNVPRCLFHGDVQLAQTKPFVKKVLLSFGHPSADQNALFGHMLSCLLVSLHLHLPLLLALFCGHTTMWDGVPEAVSVIVFLVLMCFVSMMEGMQIALFAVINMNEAELKQHPIAYAN